VKQASPTTKILKPSQLRKQENGQATPEPTAADETKLRAEIVEAAKEAGKKRQQTTNPFPLEALHPALQEFCKSHHTCFGFPVDWYGAGILAVAGTIIGNAFAAEYQPGWYGSPSYWIGLVGRSSSGKTQVMKHVERPLKARQDEMFNEHKANYENWKAEQEATGQKADPNAETPKPARLLLNKFSLEKAVMVMQKNQRGLLISRPELIGWMRSMNQYRKGDDEQTWLEFWDNNDSIIDLVKYDQPVYLKRTNLTVWGGVQDDLLHEMADGQKSESGHLGRFLFAYSDDMDKPFPAKMVPGFDVLERYAATIKRLDKMPNLINELDVKSIMVPFDEPAKEAFYQFLCSSTKAQNEAENNLQRSILGKLETYVLRFAATLALLDFAAEEKTASLDTLAYDDKGHATIPGLVITVELLTRALMLKDYFRGTSLKVTTRIESPVNKLGPDQQDWYRSLPFDEMFKTRTAIETAIELKIAQRTAETLLSNEKLFKKVKTGWYERRWF